MAKGGNCRMKKKNKRKSGGANWMDTYGDLVTLLLCFFVMLYSMSTVDNERWIALVESLNPQVEVTTPAVTAPKEENEEGGLTESEVEKEMQEVFKELTSYMDEQDMENQMTVISGSGYVFISFDDTVFFRPNSPVLLDSGKPVLDQVGLSLGKHSKAIGELRVLGHTAQGEPTRPNDPVVDRTLSSSRANNVTIYLQEKNVIDPAKLVSIGYGQWRPIASNGTSESRAKNRRVELIVTGLNMGDLSGDSTEQYYTMRNGGDPVHASP